MQADWCYFQLRINPVLLFKNDRPGFLSARSHRAIIQWPPTLKYRRVLPCISAWFSLRKKAKSVFWFFCPFVSSFLQEVVVYTLTRFTVLLLWEYKRSARYVVASLISFVPPQAAELNYSAAPPFPQNNNPSYSLRMFRIVSIQWIILYFLSIESSVFSALSFQKISQFFSLITTFNSLQNSDHLRYLDSDSPQYFAFYKSFFFSFSVTGTDFRHFTLHKIQPHSSNLWR